MVINISIQLQEYKNMTEIFQSIAKYFVLQ